MTTLGMVHLNNSICYSLSAICYSYSLFKIHPAYAVKLAGGQDLHFLLFTVHCHFYYSLIRYSLFTVHCSLSKTFPKNNHPNATKVTKHKLKRLDGNRYSPS